MQGTSDEIYAKVKQAGYGNIRIVLDGNECGDSVEHDEHQPLTGVHFNRA